MTVLSCNLIADGQGADQNHKGVREYDDVYRVVTDNRADNQFLIIFEATAFGLPILYEPYDSDPQAVCLSRKQTASSDGSGFVREITCHYSTEYDAEDNENPLERAPRWWLDGVDFSRLPEKDVFDKPILNLAGDQYATLPEIDDGRLVLMVRRHEEFFADIVTIKLLYQGTVNEGEWNGFPAFCVLLKKVTCGELKFENGVSYYEVTYEFHINMDSWFINILEQGYNALNAELIGDDPISYRKIPCAGDHPKLLVPNPGFGGCQFTDNPEEAVFTPWQVRETTDFDDLDLTFPDEEDEEPAE